MTDDGVDRYSVVGRGDHLADRRPVERLPDLKLTGLRQQLGPTPLYYESESSLGYFEREFASLDTNQFRIRFHG